MKNKIIISTIIFIVLSIISILYIYKWEYRKPLFEVNFFSLNRGRAIFIKSKDKYILIGGGQNSQTIREITKAIPFYKRKIDYIFVPSAMPNQIGGLIEIIDRYEIGEIIMPEIMATSTVLTQLKKEISKNKIHVREVKRGDRFEIDNLKIKILFPIEDFKYNKTSLPELGLEISYENTSVYLIGNLSKTIQKYISKNTEIRVGENLLEFYNSAIDSKVSSELIEKIAPKFIFSTKEKTSIWTFDGREWVKK